ncbi:C4 [Chickpea chlorosis virus-B]|nr:C4 [Chickpea chlorosis virus-B]
MNGQQNYTGWNIVQINYSHLSQNHISTHGMTRTFSATKISLSGLIRSCTR